MRQSVVMADALAEGLILSPERYDPRRTGAAEGVVLSAVAVLSKQTLRPASVTGRWRVLDTGHAESGVIRCARDPVEAVGSTKKVLTPGQVIISRLRPYLRQVALVDAGLGEPRVGLCCSSEFYVLSSVDGQSIAFLVPFLLSAVVQEALAAGQEGGHHPRFPSALLMGLRIPSARMARREADSVAVVAAVRQIRKARGRLKALER